MKGVLFLIVSLIASSAICQTDTTRNGRITEQEAKKAVYYVARYSGLYPDFIVLEDKSIKSAVAYVKNKKRYVKYNPEFIRRIANQTKTDWAAISILAHEIGHHLLGHTIKMVGSNPGDELAADRYSGFILQRMGATMDEAKKAMLVAGHDHGTKTHPPKTARLKAIEQGWADAADLNKRIPMMEKDSSSESVYTFQINFIGDDNNYYVTGDSSVVWFDNMAEPIKLGHVKISSDKNYMLQYEYKNDSYLIDWKGKIWNRTAHGSVFTVGEMIEFTN